jgi:hypothetical protein
MATEVLELCKLPDSFDIERMKQYVHNYMESRVSYYMEKGRPPFIEDEFSEYFTAKCTNGTEIGGGNCAMDVKFGDIGIDAMCVTMKGHTSNEKSLIQYFTDLDSLFNDKKDIDAVNIFKQQYYNKLQNVKDKKGLSDLYILAFISTNKDIYLAYFKINLEKINDISSGGFVDNSSVNIIVDKFINPIYGNVKLYKSKKRLELRLQKDIINSDLVVKVYSMP